MRVLLVAPRTNLLLVDAEVQDVLTSGLDVEPILGDVSRIDLTRKLRSHDFDVLWLATHGDETGILLSDGILSSATIAQLVRGRISLVVINTCDSYDTAHMLQNETEASVVCTVQKVPDDQAYHTASLFAVALSETGDPRDAYERSKPGGNRSYLFLEGKRKMQNQRPERSEKDINDLFDALLGNRMTGKIGVLDDIANIKKAIAEVNGNVSVMDVRLSKRIDAVESGLIIVQSGLSNMQVSIQQVQVSIDIRNSTSYERNNRIVMTQDRLFLYIVLCILGGGILAILVSLLFRYFIGVEKHVPSVGLAIFSLFCSARIDVRDYVLCLEAPSAGAIAFAAHAAMVRIRSIASYISAFFH